MGSGSKMHRGRERAPSPWFCSSSAFCSRRSSFLTDLSVTLPCSTMSESSADSSLRLSSCRDSGVAWGTGRTGGSTKAPHLPQVEVGAHSAAGGEAPEAGVGRGRDGSRSTAAYLALVPHLLALLVDL